MTNDTIGIIGVFAFTGLLFILRQLIVKVARPRKRVTIVTTPPAAQGAPRREDFQVKEELEPAQAQHAMAHSYPGSFPASPYRKVGGVIRTKVFTGANDSPKETARQ